MTGNATTPPAGPMRRSPSLAPHTDARALSDRRQQDVHEQPPKSTLVATVAGAVPAGRVALAPEQR
jgi:hypothetical protein